MKLKGKNLIALCLVLVLTLSIALTGCGGNQPAAEKSTTGTSTAETSKTDEIKPIKISVFFGKPGQNPTADNRIYKLIEEKLGASFEFEYLVGELAQKIGVMIAGGDYPDVVTGDTKFINAKALIPLEEKIEKNNPNLYKHYQNSNAWNKMKEPSDGHIYVMPNYGVLDDYQLVTEPMGPAFYIQKAVLADAGYPKVKTLDQYFDLIAKYKEKYPKIDGQPTIGFEILSDGWRNWGLKNAPQHLIGHPNDGNVVVDAKTGVAEIFANKEYAKRYYKKLNDMNQAGLIDKETFVLNYDQFIQKLSTGRVLGMFEQRWNFGTAQESLYTQNKDERTYVACPVTFDESIKQWYLDRTLVNVNNGFGITKNAKDPDAILKVFDTLVTEEWQKILQWGQKDIDYKVDEKGMFYRTKEQRDQQLDATWQLANKAKDLWDYGPKWEGNYPDGNGNGPGNQESEFFNNLRDYDKEFLTKYNYKTWADFYEKAPENPIFYPAWQINLIDGTPAKVADTKMDETSKKYLPQLILAKPGDFDKLWSEYEGAFGKIDVKSYEARMNEQIQWRIENWTIK